MSERRGHAVSGWLEGSSERPETWRGHPRPTENPDEPGYEAARAALSAGETGECGVETARARHVFGLFSCHWFEPLEHGLTHAREAHESLRQCGELEFACYTFFTSQTALLDVGPHLADLDAENRRAIAFAAQTGNRHAAESYAAFRGLIDALIGETAAGADDIPAANPMAACFHHTARALAACLCGDDDAHIRHADAAVRLADSITGFYLTALINVLDSLALLARRKAGDRDPALAERLAANQAWLASRGSAAAVNFSHLHDLVEAERLSADGHGTAALAVYERAISGAKAHRRPWHAALATEKAARCYLALGLAQAGYRLLEQAHTLYADWGANRKSAALAAEFPFLHTAPAGFRDAQPLMTVMQQLATLRSVPQLAAATARLLHELSGATDGHILAQDEHNQWMLEAGFSAAGPAALQTMEEAEQRGLIPATVVRLGLRRMQTVLSDDAVHDARFLGDPRFRDLEGCAVLGVPVISRNRAVAFVVLENRRVRGAFTKDMAEMVQAFCGHLAVSIENVRLYQSLEQQVAQRTRELRTVEESLARTAFEPTANIPVGTYVLEFDSSGRPRFTFVSERWLQMLDLSREDVLADHGLALNAVHPDERDAFTRLNAEAFAQKKNFQWEGRIVVRGQTRWVTIESVPRIHHGGGTIWEGVMIDITDRKAAEEKTARSEAALRNTLDTLPFAVGMCVASNSHADPEARIVFLNRNFIATYGYDVSDLPTAVAWAEKAYPNENYRREVFAWWDIAVRRLMTGESAVETHESRAVTKDGKPMDIVVSATMLEQKMVVSFLDITARKQSEQQLVEANRIMQLAASAAQFGFWERNVEAGLERWDEGMALIYGIGLADFDGRWEKFVHPEDLPGVLQLHEEGMAAGRTARFEYRIIRPDGTQRHLRGLSMRFSGGSDGAVREIGVDFDVTEEKEAALSAQHLRETHRRELETKLKTSLTAAAVAHEINQPLSTILLQSKLALEQAQGGDNALRVIAEEAQRVVVTIDKMKMLLRNVQTEHTAIDLVEVVENTLLYNKEVLARHRITLRTQGLDRNCPITGDFAQLQFALTNLIRNAAEAIAEHKPAQRDIAIELRRPEHAVELVIGDTGPGWGGEAPGELPLTTTKKSGTGIGLYVVRTAMQNHRGHVVFGHSPLGGAEVRLVFPAV